MTSVAANLWKKVEVLYHAALAEAPEKRAEFLQRACPDDPQLRGEVESLLDKGADPFLEGSPLSSIVRSGVKLGNFELLERIGRGGMGEVWRARDSRLKRDVAIKLLPAALSRDPGRIARFEHEARAASALNHPNIVSVFDVGHEKGTWWIVSELVDGESLRALIDCGPLPLRKVLEIGTQIAEGLAAAHAAGIVHRDIKPSNIMVRRDGRVKIVDFGVAKRQDPAGTATLTEPGTVLGTACYMSPEQVRGNAVDSRSDIFSLGVLLHEMLSGTKPFNGTSSIEVMNAVLKDDPPELPAATPAPLDHIVRRCLEKERAARFQSAADLAFALSWIAAAPVQEPASPIRRPWRMWSAAAALVLAATAAMTFWLRQTSRPEPPELRHLTYSGHDLHPAAAPDGRFVAFMSDRDSRRRIWLKQLVTGSETPLTEGPDDDFPRFSPDGSALLFTRNSGSGSAIYKIGLPGGELRKLVDQAALADWSPDGRRIVYLRLRTESAAVTQTIHTAAADGGDERQIAALGNHGLLNCIRWSPDGRTIAGAYQSGLSGLPASIFLVGADGGNPRLLSTPRGGSFVSAIVWSASGTEVIYSQTLAVRPTLVGRARLMRQNVNTGDVELVLIIPYDSWAVDILDSGRLVLDATTLQSSLREIRIKPEGSIDERWLTHGGSNDWQPAYSPDGEWVLFTSNRSGNLDLWEISRKSGLIRRITEDPSDDWDPNFTPDGKIIWSSNRTGNLEIWISDRDGANPRQVSRDGADAENPSGTRDGWIIYTSGNPAKRGIWRIRQDGTDAHRLFTGNVSVTEVTPDGQYVAYRSRSSESIAVLRVADGAVVPFQAADAAFRARWMPDGRSIAFLTRPEKGIVIQDFLPGHDTSNSRRRVGGSDADHVGGYFGISPDGSRLTTTDSDVQNTLMMIDHVPGVRRPARLSN